MNLPAAINRVPGPDGHSPLGRLVAEAERSAAHADIAFVPRDWIRADLAAGWVTYSDAFDVQPFGNDVVRMELRGTDLQAVIDQDRAAGGLLESSGLPTVIAPRATYSVAACEFLAAGGEGFAPFTRGTNQTRAGKDVDALVAYLERLARARSR